MAAETGSTNADVAELALAGAPEGLVLVAEAQSAGHGQAGTVLDRPTTLPVCSCLYLLRPAETGGPEVPASRWGWLPLLAGAAGCARRSSASPSCRSS